MKKVISLFAAITMLSTVAIQASALENYLPTEDKYSVGYEGLTPGAYYGMVAVEGTGADVNTTDSSKFVYIDQATANSAGKIEFNGFAPKGKGASEEGYVESTVFIGGESLNGAQMIGYLRSSKYSDVKEFVISGKIIDKVTALKGATVTVVGADKTVAVPFTADAEGTGIHSGTYSITVPADVDYSVTITKDGYLTFTYTNVDVAADVILDDVDVTLLAGDVNGDGQKILTDIEGVLADFNNKGDAIANESADVNGDGQVILTDLEAILAGFNTKSADFIQALPDATPAE